MCGLLLRIIIRSGFIKDIILSMIVELLVASGKAHSDTGTGGSFVHSWVASRIRLLSGYCLARSIFISRLMLAGRRSCWQHRTSTRLWSACSLIQDLDAHIVTQVTLTSYFQRASWPPGDHIIMVYGFAQRCGRSPEVAQPPCRRTAVGTARNQNHYDHLDPQMKISSSASPHCHTDPRQDYTPR